MDWLLCDKDLHHERVTLKTGKQAFKTIETHFLTTLKKRISKRDIFMEKCQKRGDRFEELNKKKKIKFQTFLKQINPFKLQKFSEKWTLDIFGRLLLLAIPGQIGVTKKNFLIP